MIRLQNVSKTYGTGESALSDLSLIIEKGEFAFLIGPSGSGKTTLLRLLTREMLPTEGAIYVNDIDIVTLPNSKVPHLRKKIGVVFQDLKLLMDRTIFENIILPLEMASLDHATAEKKVLEVLDQVGVASHKDKFPVQLSGGELQRVAIARALVFGPDILLADEPTGNLDSATSWEIIKLLQDINNQGTTILMATHNTDVVNSLMKRVISLEKGKLVKDERKSSKKVAKESDESASSAAEVKEPKVEKDTPDATETKDEKGETNNG
ncbi:cell division ATP-binding protein FtsE [soil metagenome]